MSFSSVQLQHIIRNVEQKFKRPTIGIIGGYHGGNLGDIALGTSVSEVLKKRNVSSGLQTIYNLDKWPKSPFAIVGGGAVGYKDSLLKVAARYKSMNQRVALLGVDFMEKDYPSECIGFMQNVAFISCRSEAQAKKISQITGREDVHFHPDIAFSLYKSFCKNQRQRENESRGKKLLINVLPLYAKMVNKKLVPEIRYKTERPELFDNFEMMHAGYKKVVRETIEQAIANGFTVHTIPFTPADNDYADLLLKGLPVKFNTYYSSPKKMLKYISESQRVIATRFHATIFALKTGVELYPVAYATKNKLMLQEIGIKRDAFLSSEDFASGVTNALNSVAVSPEQVSKAEDFSLHYIERCISAVLSAS